ncbi:SDR family oxidoreductase [Streptomyces sp. NPDC004629]|uniref:SDR family oxidoreductase n=1 Tax=Streptomyces sp. NPDC004629 TaxID=3364705 RepID=UPI003693BE20
MTVETAVTCEGHTAAQSIGSSLDVTRTAQDLAFLASDEAAYVTGVVLPVDGGIAI